jgi:hypothetical protein
MTRDRQTVRAGGMSTALVERDATYVHLGRDVRVNTLEDRANDVASSEPAWTRPLCIDLSATRWLDVPALMHLLAVIAGRHRDALETRLRLPRLRRVRDFLRAWEFPTAVGDVSGLQFRRLVTEDGLRYFGEPQRYYLGTPTGLPTVDVYRRLLRERFFGFVVRRFDADEASTALMELEWNRWRSPLVLRVLNRHLRSAGSEAAREIARVVIYELLANAVQHPGATRIALSSKVDGIDLEDGSSATRLFTVVIWDDGTSIVETLRSCLIAGEPIRIGTATRIDDVFAVKPVGWTPSSDEYNVDWTPDRHASDEELLLASVFPGITQKAGRTIPSVPLPYGPRRSQVGYGLHSLYRSVIDTFGGSLAVRTGQTFMNLKRSPAPGTVRYRAKIERLPGRPFLGNMMTIRLPVDRDG